VFRTASVGLRTHWRAEPRGARWPSGWAAAAAAALLLALPALATVFGANALADILHPLVADALAPLVAAIDAHAPAPLRVVLTARSGDMGFGLLTMGPFLLVWALPTVLLYAVVLGAYKASGLIDRIEVALHPWMRPLGLGGRTVSRVMMGFGCNVPAVLSTRSCSSCSRETAVSAISFGAACSYQLPATLAVLGASGAVGGGGTWLPLLYLAFLLVTTVAYVRLTAPPAARSRANLLVLPQEPVLQWPSPAALYREASGTVRQFLTRALPIFALICVAASVLVQVGLADLGARALGPAMAAFNLPADAALPVLMAAIRKDGIFLFAPEGSLVAPMDAVQMLTAVYLAGVLFPCMVTAYTVARELSLSTTLRMLGRQAGFAALCAGLLAWGGAWLAR